MFVILLVTCASSPGLEKIQLGQVTKPVTKILDRHFSEFISLKPEYFLGMQRYFFSQGVHEYF